MLDPLTSCHNLVRVLRFDGDPPPPTFMVFCNDRKETERLCLYARSLAPAHFVNKLLWFHSGMSTRFRTDTIEKLRTHEIWGIFCTDAAGMVRAVCIAIDHVDPASGPGPTRYRACHPVEVHIVTVYTLAATGSGSPGPFHGSDWDLHGRTTVHG